MRGRGQRAGRAPQNRDRIGCVSCPPVPHWYSHLPGPECLPGCQLLTGTGAKFIPGKAHALRASIGLKFPSFPLFHSFSSSFWRASTIQGAMLMCRSAYRMRLLCCSSPNVQRMRADSESDSGHLRREGRRANAARFRDPTEKSELVLVTV